jgi:hypothetical protein
MAALNNIRLSPTQCRHHSPAMKAVHLEMRPAGGKYKLSSSKTACGARALARQGIDMAALAVRAALGQNGKRQAMQNSSRIGRPVRPLIVTRLVATAIVVWTGLTLGSCAGGASEDGFSAYVSDHWPHWAGGLPSDVPPRPGAPGYNQFVAHGQADQDVSPPAGGANAPAVPVKPVFQTAPSAPVASSQPMKPPQAAPAALPAPQAASDDSSVVRGGLY